ncbi:multiple monosaccharide ABC transporter substrate-binding protein [Actinacidiphila soli]|jgi:putative multiple sugar transport system substrate-binding protein|uniref:multiple monosaccharide ABC transporter substrate-binding protein n=1 Tax=Actinacidiphila soli TaxID=2487275 RepID=UPI000FCAB5A3|nr:multiple monosaccharide ABC transporter substrate-binding protein [Actinacidiphila soli]
MRIARAALLRTAAAVTATLTLGAGVSACGQSSSSGSTGSKGGTIGIAMPTKSSERWIADGSNMKKQFEKLGYKADLQYANNDTSQQVNQIQNMITNGDKALVIAAIDGTALSSVLQQAADAKIPVISYDRLILGTKNVDYYATFDNYKVGQLQGGYIVDKLGLKNGKGPFNIELFAGSSDDNNTKYFFNGAYDTLKPYIDSKKLVIKSGQTQLDQVTTMRWDGATAQKRMDDILSANYGSAKVDAVLSPYDGISIGIIASLKNGGYGTKSKPLPIVTGQDAELASVKSIIAGEQTSTIYKDTRKLAQVAVQMVNAELTGGKPEVNDTKQYNNGKKTVPTYLLQPVSVDKSNYESVLVGGGYYKASDLK